MEGGEVGGGGPTADDGGEEALFLEVQADAKVQLRRGDGGQAEPGFRRVLEM